AARMLRACAANGLAQIEVVEMGLSDAEAELSIHIPDDLGNASQKSPGGATREERFHATTLDLLLKDTPCPPVFVKCDVEGAELGVLGGATRLLESEKPPMWMLELNPDTAARFGHSTDDLVRVFFEAR